jgi:hypothetical protein
LSAGERRVLDQLIGRLTERAREMANGTEDVSRDT